MSIRSAALPLVLIVAACGSPSEGDDTPPTAPVYYGQIDRLLNDNCVMCHSDDAERLAPFSLATFESAAEAAEAQPMAHAVMTRTMPPFYADDTGDCQTFRDNPWLSDDDIALLVEWVNGGRQAGEASNASPPPVPLPALERVDATLDAGEDYTPDPTVDDDFRCFLVDPGNPTDAFITAYHVKPGNPTVVHHVIAFALSTAQAEADAIQADASAPGLGYPCVGGVGVSGATMVGGWAPGGGANFFPAGTGLKIPGSRQMIVQVHYNLHHSDGNPDRTHVELELSPTVNNQALIVPVSAPINLPAGQPDVTAVGTLQIPAFIPSVTVWSSAIHMHQRGLAGTSLRETRTNTCMIDLVNWSFHWQHSYGYETPVQLSGGDELEVTCHFDTTDDTQQVTFGEGTESEMCIAFLYATGMPMGMD